MVEGYTQSEYIKRGPFVSTWDTTKSGLSTSTQVKLPLVSNGSYAFYVDWGDGSSNYINTWNQVETLHTYSVAGIKTIKIRGMILGFFSGLNLYASSERNKLISITSWGCLNFKSLPSGLPGVEFGRCVNLSLLTVNDTPRLDNATSLKGLFFQCTNIVTTINNINSWDVSKITNMSEMFSECASFNSNIGNWNVSQVTTMNKMFRGVSSFNQPIGSWDVSNVTNMGVMFNGANAFNQPIGSWNVSNVTDMGYMFLGAILFNQPLANWERSTPGDVSTTKNVTSMNFMFGSCYEFNQPIDNWNVSGVTTMGGMFYAARLAIAPPATIMKFNQPLANWERSTPGDVSTMQNVFSLYAMFTYGEGDTGPYIPTSFQQYIGNWNLKSIGYPYYASGFTKFMIGKTPATFAATYLDNIYNGWIQYKLPVLSNAGFYALTFGGAKRTTASTEGKLLLTRTANAIVISNVTNNGSGLIRVTLATAHTLITGNKIFISEVTGTTEANGLWVITNINSTTLDLQASVYSNTYISGGSLQTGYGWTIVDGGVTP
jgi:surface protein